jgi:hypothetical protein
MSPCKFAMLAYLFVTFEGSVLSSTAETITPKMVAEDSRLNRTVSISSQRMYVGDLLAQVRDSTGVNITADLRDGAADEQIALELRDTKLSELLDSLWSMFSYKGGLWHWDRRGVEGNYRYSLTKPLGARGLADRLKGLAQQLFEDQTEALLKFAQMSPKERQKRVIELSQALLQDDDKLAMTCLGDDRIWSALKLVGDVVGKDELRPLLRDGLTKSAPVSSLSEDARSFVHSVWAAGQFRHKTSQGGEWEAVPEPVQVKVYASNPNDTLGRSLFVDLQGIGGYGYSGGTPLDNILMERLRRLWIHPGDSAEGTQADVIIAASAKQNPAVINRVIAARLRELSHGSGISFIARLPRKQRDPGSPAGRAIRPFLSAVRDIPPYAYSKWRGSMLLVDYPRWYLDRESTVPWTVASELHHALEEDSGLLRTERLCAVAAQLNVPQLRALAEDVHVMSFVGDFYPLFHAAGNTPLAMKALISVRGVSLDQSTMAFFRNHEPLRPLIERNSPVAIRLTHKDGIEPERPYREYTFECAAADGTWFPVVGYRATRMPQVLRQTAK